MRSYLIDEMSLEAIKKIDAFLKDNAVSFTLEKLFWIAVPDDVLSKTQFLHENCRPHAFAVEVGGDWVKLEFLIRSLSNMQCTCPGYATPQQRDFIIHFAHNMLEQLGIVT